MAREAWKVSDDPNEAANRAYPGGGVNVGIETIVGDLKERETKAVGSNWKSWAEGPH